MMDPALNNALSQPDIKHVLLLAIDHADITIRKYIWRGYRPNYSPKKELMVGDKTAKDFVNEALKRLCDGTRTYNPQKALIDNLNSVTDSLIWSEKKSSDRTGIVDFVENPNEEDPSPSPISKAVSPEYDAAAKLVENEIATNQEKCFQMIKASFDGDKQMQDYLDALRAEFSDINEISALTGIPVPKIYELRRKLKKYAPEFFGVPNYKELERKVKEGQ
jgi:hypothetical protein